VTSGIPANDGREDRDRLLPALDRFLARVEITEGCWLWRGALSAGYGGIGVGGKTVRAHRFAYAVLVGPVPEGRHLDLLGRVRNCVNPDHLEPVTPAENIRRGLTGENNAVKTHCPKGHSYDEANTYLTPRGWRRCLPCAREADARYRENRRSPRVFSETK